MASVRPPGCEPPRSPRPGAASTSPASGLGPRRYHRRGGRNSMRDARSMTRQDDPTPAAWQQKKTVHWYLDSVRGAIPFAREQFALLLQIVENGRQPVRRFLDLGAGDGILSAVLLARYPAAEPVLVDFSSPMLAAAKERLALLATQPAFVN